MAHGRNTRGREFPEMKYKAEKGQAIAFYQQNRIPQTLEALLNKMYKVMPDDLYGYMAGHFYALSKEPVISSLSASEGLDSVGEKSIDIDIHCTVSGIDKLVNSCSLSEEPYLCPPPPTSLTTTNKGGKRASKGHIANLWSPSLSNSHGSGSIPVASIKPGDRKVNSIITIQTHISEALKGMPVKKQYSVDEELERLRVTAASKKILLHPSSFLAASCAVALAGSQLSTSPLFLHLSSFRNHSATTCSSTSRPRRATCSAKIMQMSKFSMPLSGSDRAQSSTVISKTKGERSRIEASDTSLLKSLSIPEHFPPSSELKYTLPIPVVAALGRSCGKLKIKEFCVLPLPGSPLPQQIKMLERIHAELGRVLSAKFGSSICCTLPNGAYCPTLDKLEQGLDLLKETVANVDLQVEVDVGILIDVGADSLYDEEKGKYELVTGQLKNTDEIISIYSDLFRSGNGLLGFIDPLHPKDLEGWKKLKDKLGSKCFIVADGALRKGLPLAKGSVERRRLSLSSDMVGAVELENGVEGLSCAALTLEYTVTYTMDKASHLKDCSRNVMARVPTNLTVNTVMVDLAVAAHCQFIRLGAPIGMTTVLLNRMLRIRQELISRKLHEPAQAHLFESNFE